ncbi:MAG: lipoprotein signal peptidase [Bacteroidetes bacterium HGW-Bacteroidetes-4]|jgi:signal peptidase II|nr:MAG: lipoprotein signal peptidase [Bacteroidetes bacterium HGW-Bacteroidetes-4]
MTRGRLVILIIFLILLADQVLKFWIKTNMMLGQEYRIAGDWFIIHFTENNGMAFGFEFAGKIGKYFLSIFRIVAVTFISIYLARLIKKEVPLGFLISVALILAGASGNIIDSAFYGLLFEHSSYQVSQFMPNGGGYAGFLQGRVVDMFYFPIIEGHWPSWSPIKPTESFIFFRPVFNIADSAISVGMMLILFFYRKVLQKEL